MKEISKHLKRKIRNYVTNDDEASSDEDVNFDHGDKEDVLLTAYRVKMAFLHNEELLDQRRR